MDSSNGKFYFILSRVKLLKYLFLTIFFFFLRLNSDRQFVESYWGEVNEINVGMDFVNFI